MTAPTAVDLVRRWATEKPHAPAYTFLDYQTDPGGQRHTLTWSGVDRRARATAAAIRSHAVPGDRVAILAPQGLDYLVALLGSFYARTIAVPLFPPGLSGHRARLDNALAHSRPVCILTTGDVAVDNYPVVALDNLGDHDWRPEPIDGNEIAYLQYTSGATGTPSAVMVTHANLVANIDQLITAFHFQPGRSTTVSWLPLWHDMGLVLAFGVPLRYGDQSSFIDPLAFLMRPARWLDLARSALDVYTAGPNFGYDYCTRRITNKAAVDLSQVKVFLNGAEPVRAHTIEAFTNAFQVPPATHTPAYGLAEATVFVTSAAVSRPPTAQAFDREALRIGMLKPSDRGHELVSLGKPTGQRLEIVDSGGHPCGPGVIGEIWLQGPNVAAGYWNDPARTAKVFGAHLADGTGPWLRTGDLGALYDGELYLTGRLKDLIIIDGRNHHPQDIEATVEAAHPQLKPGRTVAFSVTAPDTEHLVVLIESSNLPEGAIKAAVQRDHGLHIQHLLEVPRGTIQRTSSGKLARAATRAWYLSNQ
ncbi:fatty acyl-AMP ligase [Kribbella antibiotica]|uniref:Fatty acyl-AMP ligase n=1 Tax=Kribbella antibiotica TaxID=190195 RepID=A0A4R4ZQE0_9ACTN|nr:fatty acyl-AMP ligase [Kribbella antibiotica]TDD61168.1 fatty acyl-AMP ligase [Kribbella antibiotica]